VAIPPQLLDLLCQDGFTIFVRGGKEHGKTNLAMLLMEIAHEFGLRKHFATNIKTESYYIDQITNKPDLDTWLQKKKGLKTYACDELGKNLKKFGFATKKNQSMMDVIQLIRHFDCGFIGMAPHGKFVDSGFLIANDILDADIRKISKTTAKVIDYLHGETYFWCDIPATNIIHNGKDIAKFEMEKPEDLTNAPLCCKLAAYAAKLHENEASMGKIGRMFGLNSEQAKRELIKHLKHSNHMSLIPVEVVNTTESKPEA
jgi:hypothetical protein